MYQVKEIYYTLQGEGVNAGRPAVFCRFAGCNLWSGREADRANAQCDFCDTDFVGTDGPGGGQFASASGVAEACLKAAGTDTTRHDDGLRLLVVLTGGEPMLQADAALLDALHEVGFEIAIETNGTLPVPRAIDWICVSPKAGTKLVQTSGDELKIVYPQAGLDPASLVALDFKHRLLQPMDNADITDNTAAAIAYCKAHPAWRLSVQTHKVLGID